MLGNKDLVYAETPEGRELAKKRSELAILETKLAEDELKLATAQAALRAFELHYLRSVGSRYAELDQIEAEIAERVAALYPGDTQPADAARDTKARAEESARVVGHKNEWRMARGEFKPSGELRDLYRKLAKIVHPDLAGDPEEIERRQRFMAQVNQAYEDGDEAKLRQILREWESTPESVKGDGPGAELVRAIRKIAKVEDRLVQIQSEMSRLKESDLFKLRAKARVARKESRDLFAEMCSELNEQIAKAKEELRRLRKEEAQHDGPRGK